ncbi:zinc-finger domain-containing protein [Bacillus cereus]|uniref:zinc-finger domain-containing protein n=1 Tax=Bacillus cereus TaxID=1396 RepID=UPI0021136B12|nr:zinc-finger domain-containing protein [Bacillus cereus]
MDVRATRIRILNLQDQHCTDCEYRIGPHTYCLDHCEMGEEIHQLGSNLINDEKSRERRTKLKWDKVCQDVFVLKKEGLIYVQIAEILGYDKSTIRQQLKKRGLLES